MSIYNSEVIVVQEDLPANVNGASNPIRNVNNLESYTVFAIFQSLGGSATGTVSIEVSPDGVNWTTYIGTAQAYTSSTVMHSWEFQTPSHVMSRVFNQTTVPNGGTIKILVSRKGTNS